MNLNDIKNSISSLTLYGNNDTILSSLLKICNINPQDISFSLQNYCNFCRLLYEKEASLSKYLKNHVLYSENPFSKAAASGKTYPLIESAAKKDLAIIDKLSKLKSSHLKKLLADKFNQPELFDNLPDYETSSEDFSYENIISFYRSNGYGDFAKCSAFTYEKLDGRYTLNPIFNTDPITLNELKQYESQRQKIVDNTLAFVKGKPYNNALLYGDRGTGKSSTVKAVLNEFKSQGLRMIQIDKQNLYGLPQLTEKLCSVPLKFILFVDDLTFNENDDSFGMLKAVLEGGVVKRPDNIAIYATSNRRHLIKETFSSRAGDELHHADTIDETMSLSDRFGLTVTFLMPRKDKFLELVKELCDDRGITVDQEKLFRDAERFAVNKGNRTPRLAKQFIDNLESRLSLGLSI